VSPAVVGKNGRAQFAPSFRAGTSVGRVLRVANWGGVSEIRSPLSDLVSALHLGRIPGPVAVPVLACGGWPACGVNGLAGVRAQWGCISSWACVGNPLPALVPPLHEAQAWAVPDVDVVAVRLCPMFARSGGPVGCVNGSTSVRRARKADPVQMQQSPVSC
jgi:hypothetical protein